MELHPYDGIERRFRHTDPVPGYGPEALALVLRLSHVPAGKLLYDLSFYSGGVGIIDNLAASVSATPELWAEAIAGMRAQTLEEAASDPDWTPELRWLLTSAEDPVPLRPAAVEFIAEHQLGFQSICRPEDRILFEHGSNGNHWGILWGDDARLNFLGYDQG